MIHNLVDKIATNTVWLTPENPDLAAVRTYAPIGLDPCTEASNPTGASRHFTIEDNGLVQDWANQGLVFVNPPYSLTPEAKAAKQEPPIRAWTKKISEEAIKGVEIIALLPCGARFSTGYWQKNILQNPKLYVVCFRLGRIKFIDGRTGKVGKGNNYDSMYYGFNIDKYRFASNFKKLGTVLEVINLNGDPV